MSAVFRVHEVTLEPEDNHVESAFTVRLSGGRKLTVFSSGNLTLHVPYDDSDPRFTEAVDISWPSMEDIAARCNQETGEMPVTGWHRH